MRYDHFTMRELYKNIPLIWRVLIEGAAISIAAGIFLAVLGPFGSYESMSPWQGFFYWTLAFAIGMASYGSTIFYAEKLASAHGIAWPIWFSVGVLLATFPATLGIVILGMLLGDTADPGQIDWFGAYWNVLAIGVVASAFYTYIILRKENGTGQDENSEASASFFRQIPKALGSELLCLCSEDHYLRVHTSEGNDLILMRLRDAINALNGSAGMQVHRSWWVAEGAVTGSKKQGRKAMLTLKNGLEVPVARSFMPDVRRAGWLI